MGSPWHQRPISTDSNRGKFVATGTAPGVDASTSRLYATHTDPVLSPWCYLTLQRPLWGTRLLLRLWTVAFIEYDRRSPTFIPQSLKKRLMDRLLPVGL